MCCDESPGPPLDPMHITENRGVKGNFRDFTGNMPMFIFCTPKSRQNGPFARWASYLGWN
jgi:hypothetical protein